jgi:hypothetical protein
MEAAGSDRPYAPPASGPRVEEAILKKTSVLLMVALTLLTLGLYFPYWFLTRRRALNRLAAETDDVNLLTFGVVATMVISLAGGFCAAAFPETAGWLSDGVRFVDFIFRILTILLCFRIKSILEANHPERLSALATFFLSLFYLQYKINRMEETDPVAVQFSLR